MGEISIGLRKALAVTLSLTAIAFSAHSLSIEPEEIDFDNLPTYSFNAVGPIFVDGIYYNVYRSHELLKDPSQDSYLAAVVCSYSYLSQPTHDGASNYTGEITIPETIEYAGRTFVVDALGTLAFANATGLTKLNLPNTIRVINPRCFENCYNLTELKLPNTMNMIHQFAFAVKSIKELTLPDTLLQIEPQIYESGSPLVFNPTRIKFSSNSFIPEKGYAPISEYGFQGTYNGTKILEFPGTRFSMYWVYEPYVFNGPADAGYIAAYFNPTDRFASVKGALSKHSLKYIISAAEVPPVIEAPGPEMIQPYGEPYSQKDIDTYEYVWTNRMTCKEPGLFGKYADIDDMTLVVPRGSEQAYAEAPVWSEFKKIRGVDNIEQYRNEDALAALEQITEDNATSVTVRVENSRVIITAPEGTDVTILSPDGRICDTLRTSASVSESRDLSAGLYLVRAAGLTFKILVRVL